MNVEKNKISIWVIIIVLFTTLFVVGSVSWLLYSYFSTPTNVDKIELSGGELNLTYTDDDCGLTITPLTLTSDQDGIKIDSADMYFDFSISSKLDEASKIDYEISIIPNSKNMTVPVEFVKVYLEKVETGSYKSVCDPATVKLSTNKSELGSKKGSMIIYKTTKTKSTSDNYRLRVWVSDQSGYTLSPADTISFNIDLHGKTY